MSFPLFLSVTFLSGTFPFAFTNAIILVTLCISHRPRFHNFPFTVFTLFGNVGIPFTACAFILIKGKKKQGVISEREDSLMPGRSPKNSAGHIRDLPAEGTAFAVSIRHGYTHIIIMKMCQPDFDDPETYGQLQYYFGIFRGRGACSKSSTFGAYDFRDSRRRCVRADSTIRHWWVPLLQSQKSE